MGIIMDFFMSRPRVEPPPELSFSLIPQSEIESDSLDWSSEQIKKQRPTDIVLLTANNHEFRACYSYLKIDGQVQRSSYSDLGIVHFGKFGDQKVALMRCQQGPNKAQTVVAQAVKFLNPKVVLFVGLCATLNPSKAKLGNVLISSKLESHDDKKVCADGRSEYRGPKTEVSNNMARLIQHAGDGWKPPLKDPKSLEVEVHQDATILSGASLVNNSQKRQELQDDFPYALGLEMEGKGLYEAARVSRIEWAVIKGVSDFADGSKESTELWQPFASVMAASVVHHMFKPTGVIKNWPRANTALEDQEMAESIRTINISDVNSAIIGDHVTVNHYHE